MARIQQKITPFLWFDTQAEEAAKFYCSVFKNAKIHSVSRYPEGSPFPPGTAMTVEFELEGLRFTALNAGPIFKFTEAISFVVMCEDQKEVDHFWNTLTKDGGQESDCGWLKDKYGLSWQITPIQLIEAITDKDPKKAEKAMKAMMTMRKIDIAALKKAQGQ